MLLLDELGALFIFLAEAQPVPLVMLELDSKDFGGKTIFVDAHRLKTPTHFAPRFREIMETGYSWVNLSYRGRLGDKSLVTVELPHAPVGAATTSVNYSGPSNGALASSGLTCEEFRIVAGGDGCPVRH